MPRERTERAVFVAADGRRARWVRYGAVIAILLGCVWLAGLGIGMLSLGQLPGVSLPSLARGDDKGSTERAKTRGHALSRALPAAAAARPIRRAAAPSTGGVAEPRILLTRSRRASQLARPARAVQPPVEAVSAPAPIRQGWSRRGWSTPPGQSRRPQPQPTATALGQIRRSGTETTKPATPATPPTPTSSPPPGQQKKAEEPKAKG